MSQLTRLSYYKNPSQPGHHPRLYRFQYNEHTKRTYTVMQTHTLRTGPISGHTVAFIRRQQVWTLLDVRVDFKNL